MLITSRETQRWIIPKGWSGKGSSPSRVAKREALEEAGLVGAVGKRPVGSYCYDKRLDDGSSVPCTVEVFPMLVKRQLIDWPERCQRQLRWVRPAEAIEKVGDAALGRLLRTMEWDPVSAGWLPGSGRKRKWRRSDRSSKAALPEAGVATLPA